MLLSKLLEWDTSLLLCSPTREEETLDVFGVTTPEFPKANHLIFIKSRNFLKRLVLIEKKLLGELGLIVSKEIYEKEFAQGEFTTVLQNVSWLLTSPDVPLSMARLSFPFYQQKMDRWNLQRDGREFAFCEVDPTAILAKDTFIGEGVAIGKNVVIHPHVTIMAGATIGEGTILFPNVTIYPSVTIGRNCRIHAGSVIGADGFGYHFNQGVHLKIWQMGGVFIGDDVEIGANSAIDCGTFTPTVIGSGCKLDNFIHIGHNCVLGKGVIMCGQSALSGSCRIGDFTVFGGRSGCAPETTLGAGCQIAGGALIGCDWPAGSVLGGHPARPLQEWMRGIAYVRKESLRTSQKKSPTNTNEQEVPCSN